MFYEAVAGMAVHSDYIWPPDFPGALLGWPADFGQGQWLFLTDFQAVGAA